MSLGAGRTIALVVLLSVLAVLSIASPDALKSGRWGAPNPILPEGTLVPDLITGDVTWDPLGSPYIVTHDAYVDARASLTILAGVEVRFEGVWRMAVNGTLRAQGELGNPVTFRQNRTGMQSQFVVRGSSAIVSFRHAVLDNGRVIANLTELEADGLTVRCTVLACDAAIEAGAFSKVTLRDVAIDGGSAVTTWGVEALDTPGLILDTFSIEGMSGGVSAGRCDGCRIANGTFIGLSTSANKGVELSGRDSAILNLHFLAPGSHEQIAAYGDRNVIRGNHVEAGDFAIGAGGTGIVIEGNVVENPRDFGISVYPTAGALIRNNRVTGGRVSGISLGAGSQPAYGSTVLGNFVSESGAGILSEQAQGLIRGNTLRGNTVGVELRGGSNQVDHNHLEFNTAQARDTFPGNSWDDGYPSGGNWWSDYADNDVYSGPLQSIPGPDGIGDAPYAIDADSQDRYPFYSVPAPGIPEELTATAPIGGLVRLTWRAAPMADSYELYTARTPTGFDFGVPMRLPNVTAWTDFGSRAPGAHYYVVRAHNTTVGRTGATSNTAGAWTKEFPAGVSTFSLPLAAYPWIDYTASGWVDTAGEFLTFTGAKGLYYMEAGRWRSVPGDGDPNRTLRVGAGYLVDFAARASVNFVGLPAAMIDYATWPPYPLAGFDAATTARELAATVTGDDVVLTWPSLAGIPPGNGTYRVFASRSPGVLRGDPGTDDDLLATVPATAAATVWYTHVSALRAGPAWYYLVVPVRAVYLRGASTYSVGVLATPLDLGYTAIGLPLQPFENGTYVARQVSSLSRPEFSGIQWLDPSRGDWVAHAAWMPAGMYDADFEMIMGVQVDATTPTRIVFVGV